MPSLSSQPRPGPEQALAQTRLGVRSPRLREGRSNSGSLTSSTKACSPEPAWSPCLFVSHLIVSKQEKQRDLQGVAGRGVSMALETTISRSFPGAQGEGSEEGPGGRLRSLASQKPPCVPCHKKSLQTWGRNDHEAGLDSLAPGVCKKTPVLGDLVSPGYTGPQRPGGGREHESQLLPEIVQIPPPGR